MATISTVVHRALHREPGDVERLRVDEPVHRKAEELAERRGGDVRRRERRLGEVRARPGHVVVVREDVDERGGAA